MSEGCSGSMARYDRACCAEQVREQGTGLHRSRAPLLRTLHRAKAVRATAPGDSCQAAEAVVKY
jgi:hypothetical protein